jgi:hypothetical protein
MSVLNVFPGGEGVMGSEEGVKTQSFDRIRTLLSCPPNFTKNREVCSSL